MYLKIIGFITVLYDKSKRVLLYLHIVAVLAICANSNNIIFCIATVTRSIVWTIALSNFLFSTDGDEGCFIKWLFFPFFFYLLLHEQSIKDLGWDTVIFNNLQYLVPGLLVCQGGNTNLGD